MKLNLKRPMVFFDLETTGTNITTDRIVQISMVKVMPDGEEIVRTRYINPGMPIPAEATAVHHITDEMVCNEPTFAQIAKSLREFIEDCDFCGFNSSRFDLPMLAEEFLRAKFTLEDVKFLKEAKHIDVQTIFHKRQKRTLSAAYRFYCNKDLEGAHDAQADTKATYDILCKQLDFYSTPNEVFEIKFKVEPDDVLVNDVDALAKESSWSDVEYLDFAGYIAKDKDGDAVFKFGQHRDRKLKEVFADGRYADYNNWIQTHVFPEYTKYVCQSVYDEVCQEKMRALKELHKK